MKTVQINENQYIVSERMVDLYPEALFVIEIHHQYVGNVYMADGKADFVSKNAQAAEQGRAGDIPESDDFDVWADYAASDLRAQEIMNLEEATKYCEDGRSGSGKLEKLLRDWGFIEIQESEDD